MADGSGFKCSKPALAMNVRTHGVATTFYSPRPDCRRGQRVTVRPLWPCLNITMKMLTDYMAGLVAILGVLVIIATLPVLVIIELLVIAPYQIGKLLREKV